jgi:hypothetical protein
VEEALERQSVVYMAHSPTPERAPKSLTADRREVRRLMALLAKRPLGLRDYHALGEQVRLLSQDEAVAQRGSGWRDRLAELVGCSVATLNKALQFRQAYEEDELPTLERLGVGWSMLTVALTVAKKGDRHKLLREARDAGWAERDLQRAIQQKRKTRRGGGRPRAEPKGHGLLADLAELTSLTQAWLLWHRKVWAASGGAYEAEADALPEDAREAFREQLEEARSGLDALLKEGRQAKEVLAALRKSLGEG